MASITRHRPLYFVARNARGSLPVYSDLRNAGTRYQIHVRNVLGRVDSLAKDLEQSLFPADSPHAKQLSVKVLHQRHVVLSGGRFRRDVMAWLTAKGF